MFGYCHAATRINVLCMWLLPLVVTRSANLCFGSVLIRFSATSSFKSYLRLSLLALTLMSENDLTCITQNLGIKIVLGNVACFVFILSLCVASVSINYQRCM